MKADQKPIIYSLGISVLIHLLFLLFSMGVEIPGIKAMVDRPKKIFKIKTLQSNVPDRQVIHVDSNSKRLKFQSPDESAEGKTSSAVQQIEKRTSFSFEDENLTKPVITQSQKFVKQTEKKKDYSQMQKDAKKSENAAVMEVKEIKPLTPQEIIEQEGITEEFFDKMPGFTPELNTPMQEADFRKDENILQRGYTPLVTRSSGASNLKQYLESQLRVYEDPKTKEKYFEISIRLGADGKGLPVAPKEIIFLIDCSKSTTFERLQEFKKGLDHSLRNLNPGDKFNIIAFKKQSIKFKGQSVEPNEGNVKEALKFVEGLSVGTTTDAYTALNESIHLPLTIKPSYIVLLSDGHPTQGVTDPSKIIHEISDINKATRSIFSFSGGLRVNRYLLDFLTYKNRGWAEYSYRTHLIGNNMSSMYNKIRNPIILNLRYLTSALNYQNVFPKVLPDFFKDIEFTLYGTYTDETKFALQLLGDLDNQPVELIVDGDFTKAIKGGQDIAENWAFNKIYDLIGQLKKGQDNTALLKEIEELSRKFKIKTPYIDEFNAPLVQN